MRLTRSSRPLRRRTPIITASIAAFALALTSCSSDDPATSPAGLDTDALSRLSSIMGELPTEIMDGADTDFDTDTDADTGSGDDDALDGADADADSQAGSSEAPPVEWRMPQGADNDPADWQRGATLCEDYAAGIGGFVTFAVPGAWESSTLGDGTGRPGEIDYRKDYRTDSGDVRVEIKSDSISLDDDFSRERTFDYDSKIGDAQVRIVFDSLGDVPLGEQSPELFVVKPDQAPEHLHRVLYKTRVSHLDLPYLMGDGEWHMLPYTFVVTISYDPAKSDVPVDTVRSIISSLVTPECTTDDFVTWYESMHQYDINGDGHVSTREDYQELLEQPR